MSIALNILILIAGLSLIVLGADWLVDGASGVARKAGISEFVIGLTIVGFGTSCPELVVSLTGAFAGNSDISIGNVVGSNICNTLLILGLTAVIAPLAITKENKYRDIPINLFVTILLILMGMNATILGIGSTTASAESKVCSSFSFSRSIYISASRTVLALKTAEKTKSSA